MTADRKVTLAAYDGRHLLGRVEITNRERRAPRVKATDASGKVIGTFKSQRAALRAIDRANTKRGRQ